jgi:hypothetical protein
MAPVPEIPGGLVRAQLRARDRRRIRESRANFVIEIGISPRQLAGQLRMMACWCSPCLNAWNP